MNIFINARFLAQPVTGVQRYGIECSQQIKRICPNAIFLSPGGIIHHKLAEELEVVTLGQQTGHRWEQTELPAYLKKQGFPPLINLANTAPLFYRNNFLTIHDLAFHFHPEWNSRLFSAWYNFMLPRLARRAKHLFTVSETVKSEIATTYHIPSGKISVTYNGTPSNWQHPAPAITKEKIILSVGTFNIRKNQINLVKGFLESKASKNFTLILVGDKNKVFAETGINEQDLKSKGITILQGVDEASLRDLYQRAAIIASVSLYEGFGIPLAEGWQERCLLLCSDIPVYRELYSGAAEFCKPTDVSDIARCIDTVAERYLLNKNETLTLLPEKYSFALSAKKILEAVEATK